MIRFQRLYPALLICMIVLLVPAAADQQALGKFGSFIDLPEGWQLAGQESDKLTFAFGGDAAYLQLKRFPDMGSLEDLVSEAQTRVGGSGNGTRFDYGGGEAYFGTLDFQSGDFSFSGYLFAFFSPSLDPVVILGFSDADRLGSFNDQILSALDSYSPLEATDRLPGPVGAFDRVFSRGKPVHVALDIGGKLNRVSLDQGEIETASYVTEREARILGTAGTVVSWKRFFRILYRDSLSSLSPVIGTLHRIYPANPSPEESRRIAEELLTWLQGFSYRRSGTYSDFLDPLQAIITSSGDCDSLGMLYALLLHSFNIDAILLVSEKYSHALGAADVPGKGARFPVNGTGYVVAEMTDQVDLGLIAADMADPAGWIPVFFPQNIRAVSTVRN